MRPERKTGHLVGTLKKMTMAERAKLAARCGIGPAYISVVASGHQNVSLRFAKLVCKYGKVPGLSERRVIRELWAEPVSKKKAQSSRA